MVDQFIGQVLIPRLVFNALLPMRCVVPYFVKMADDVEPSGIEHTVRLAKNVSTT